MTARPMRPRTSRARSAAPCATSRNGHWASRRRLNHGVELARGDLLAFLDADDLWTQDKLRLQTDALSARPELDAVFGHAVIFGETVAEAPPVAGYGRSAMLVRRAAFDRVGAFGDWPRLGEFIDWYARAVDLGLQTLMLADVVMLRRVHDDNMGVRLRDERTDYTRVLKGILDRRRAADAP